MYIIGRDFNRLVIHLVCQIPTARSISWLFMVIMVLKLKKKIQSMMSIKSIDYKDHRQI